MGTDMRGIGGIEDTRAELDEDGACCKGIGGAANSTKPLRGYPPVSRGEARATSFSDGIQRESLLSSESSR